ncbi:MAG TPA: sugar transferase, partial [Aliidongia sp.]|nr:sugar transferase [Aliidongia sp.]
MRMESTERVAAPQAVMGTVLHSGKLHTGIATPGLRKPAEQPGKRAFDVVGSVLLILLFGPLLLLVALAVRCDGGDALFGHRRIGAGGQ